MESVHDMLMGISTTQLKKLKEHIDDMKPIIDNAIKNRTKIMDYTETEQEWRVDQFYDPEKYYTCRFLEKAVQISLTNRIYNTEYNTWIRSRKKYYTIKCQKFLPNKEVYKDIKVDNVNMCFGQYETLEEAKKQYLIFIADFISQNGYDLFEDLKLFKD